jgi:cytochrome c-type biogenesis protein CcmH
VITFWLLAAALMAGAMLCLLPPLLRATRHEPATTAEPEPALSLYHGHLEELESDLQAGTLAPEHHRAARDEAGRRLLDAADTRPAAVHANRPSPQLAAILLAVLPSAAIVLYLHLGNPLALWQPDDSGHGHDDARATSAAQVEGMVNQLAQRLRREPDDVEGWVLLARSYTALERHADAALAYARAVALAPDEAELRADYADVLASVDGGTLNGIAFEQITRALALDPDQPKALALAASAAAERGDAAEAVRYWEHLQRLLPSGSRTAERIAANLAQARSQATRVAQVQGEDRTLAPEAISGWVKLGDKTGRKPAPGETVFVYARMAGGPRTPLAVMKRRADELPFAFVLDDSLAMRPDHRLSRAGQVIVEARISRNGRATPSAGDLVGSSRPVPAGQRGLEITIDRMLTAEPAN